MDSAFKEEGQAVDLANINVIRGDDWANTDSCESALSQMKEPEVKLGVAKAPER